MKIAVLGYSGAGKSTLARALGMRYNVPVLHFDRVHWAPGWQVRDREEAHRLVHKFMENSAWVIEGNYTKFEYKRRLAEADSILLLELPRLNCFWRAWKRYFHYRGRAREDMCEGCPEKMDLEFIRWLMLESRSGLKKKWLEAGLGEHLDKVTVLRSQKEINRYLEGLSC